MRVIKLTRAGSSAAAVLVLAASARAALPIFGGVGSVDGEFSSVFYPQLYNLDHRIVNNAGVAIATATKDNDANVQLGSRGFRWSPRTSLQQLVPLLSDNVYSDTQPWSINSSGYTVGSAENPHDILFDRRQPIFFFPTSPYPVLLTTLTPAASNSHGVAFSINDNNVIVGQSSKYSGSTDLGTRAVRWLTPSITAPQELQPLELNSSGAGVAYATMIANTGWTLGYSYRFGNTAAGMGTRVTRWSPTGTTPQELEPISTTPAGVSGSVVRDVNASGRAVGQSTYYIGSTRIDERAARWGNDPTNTTNGGYVTQLDLLPLVSGATRTRSIAFAMNDAGVAVGSQTDYASAGATTDLAVRAIRWSANATTATQLSVPAAYGAAGAASAYEINNLGTVAGYVAPNANPSNDQLHAAIWLPGSTTPLLLESLNSSLLNPWTMRIAEAITDTGFVTGLGTYQYFGSNPGVAERTFTMLIPQAGTYGKGDANFDTIVNFDDLVIVAQNYNKPNASQNVDVGDLNLDGVVNFDDLVPLAQNYNKAIGSGFLVGETSFAADWALAQSLVPEPTTLAAIVLLPMAVRRRSSR